METFYIKNIRDAQHTKAELEKKLNIKIKITGRRVEITGEPFYEYEAQLVFKAIEFGFPVKKALSLMNEEFSFRIVRIKEHTKRNLKNILSRVIGTKGKTKRVLSEISSCDIIIKNGEVGVMGEVTDVENAERAIINIIKGSKQANMYRYLEKMNRLKKRIL